MHWHRHDHGHDSGADRPHGRADPAGRHDRAFAVGLGLNLAFVAVEAVAGWYSGSLALLADAGHNLGDVLALALAWAGSWIARRPATARHTYGWRRATIYAAAINAAMLLAIAGAMAWEALRRVADPMPVDASVVIGVAAAGIVVNGLTAWLFLAGQRHDLNLRGAYLHMVADAAVSAGVVASGIVVAYTGWLPIDPLVSLLIALLVGLGSLSLLRQSGALALDAVPPSIDPDAVRRHLLALPGVVTIHDLHVWALGTSGVALTAHVVMPAGHPGDAFLQEAAESLRSAFRIDHATLQIETAGAGCVQDCAPSQ
jgi:cobalt-zinc-cadmium efflux system protein